ncbi:MAG: DUF4388 domain-containing protein [Thermodesulfobacteriota bacterium]
MVRDILIMDLDESFLTQAIEKLDEYSDTFLVLVSTGEDDAKAELAKRPVSVAVVGLTGPSGGPGSPLLDFLAESYPEMPVMLLADASDAEAKKQVQKRGLAGLMERPVDLHQMARKITSLLKKEADAGSLRGVSPGMFLQMIEMEERSCVIRMENEKKSLLGILFFRNGELLDARVKDLEGVEAAYEIFSWDEVALSIQSGCPPKDGRIHMNAQAVLLEAMRRKDESGKRPAAAAAESLSDHDDDLSEGDLTEGAAVSLGDYEELSDEDLVAGEQPAQEAEEAPVQANTADAIRDRLDREIGGKCGLETIGEDASVQSFVILAEKLGALFDAGNFKLGYFDNDSGADRIVVPGNPATVVSLKPRCPKNRIIQVLTT